MANGLTGCSGMWKKLSWKIDYKEIVEEVCGLTSLIVQNTWRYLCPRWMVTLQRRILIIKWTDWPLLWILVSLLSKPPLSSLIKLMNKLPMMAGMDLKHELIIWTSTHQGQLGCGHCWVPNLPATESSLNSPVWQIPGVLSRFCSRLMTLNNFHC